MTFYIRIRIRIRTIGWIRIRPNRFGSEPQTTASFQLVVTFLFWCAGITTPRTGPESYRQSSPSSTWRVWPTELPTEMSPSGNRTGETLRLVILSRPQLVMFDVESLRCEDDDGRWWMNMLIKINRLWRCWMIDGVDVDQQMDWLIAYWAMIFKWDEF